jgi:hypothetical protein
MVHFFGKSLSGIRTLIEDQRQAVEVITKKPPSVSNPYLLPTPSPVTNAPSRESS